jgi:hypothetical protein
MVVWLDTAPITSFLHFPCCIVLDPTTWLHVYITVGTCSAQFELHNSI